ncbi:MAG: hypothetical protein AAFQ14_14635 [Cyanobacteria bacterium J06621_12]
MKPTTNLDFNFLSQILSVVLNSISFFLKLLDLENQANFLHSDRRFFAARLL